jgi:hypothetical protein
MWQGVFFRLQQEAFMGQYWLVVNLDKREFIEPHKLGCGMKLGEQLGAWPGTPNALFILTAAMRERRGGGDFDWDSNYYGPERTAQHPLGAPVNEVYNAVAKRTIGRWAGDRVAVVGDYSEDGDLPGSPVPLGSIVGLCQDPASGWVDVSDDVVQVVEHECDGKYTGTGWREFVPNKK